MFHWDTSTSQFVPAQAGGGVFPSPFGSNGIIGTGCVPCDIDGDGYDSLVCVAQGAVPPVNNAPGSRVVVMSQPKGGGAFTRAFTVDTIPPTVTGRINVAAGHISISGGPSLSGRTAQIVTTYTDPDTGATDVAVDQGADPISFVDKTYSHKTDVWAWGRSTLHTEGVIHRDLAARCCMADLDGDGTDEIILSGNDGAEPIVSILSLAPVTDPDGTSTDLQVVRERVLDLEDVLKNYDSSELSSLIFNPSVTATEFTSTDPDALGVRPLDMPSDSGTLFLTPDFVPEPTSMTLLTLAAFGILKRRRPSI
jgi:hypothetical protein